MLSMTHSHRFIFENGIRITLKVTLNQNFLVYRKFYNISVCKSSNFINSVESTSDKVGHSIIKKKSNFLKICILE